MATKKKVATPEVEQEPVVEVKTSREEHHSDIEGDIKIVSNGKQQQILEAFEDAVKPANQEVKMPETMDEMFDRLQHLSYVVDASISMAAGLPEDEQLKAWIWPDEKLKAVRALMAKAERDEAAILGGDGHDDDDDDVFDDDDDMFDDEPTVADMSDDEIKSHILNNGTVKNWRDMEYQGITFKRNPGYNQPQFRTKMQAVKDGAADMVRARFKKWPQAKVAVTMFSDSPTRLAKHGASEDDVLRAVASMPDRGIGGTDIYRAVVAALREFARNPADVPAHHIILVSDGCDPGAERLDEHIAEMKDFGVVFDFIYIEGDTFMLHAGDRTIATLKKICEATGGEFVTVKTAKDFMLKLLAASNRPMLPAPR